MAFARIYALYSYPFPISANDYTPTRSGHICAISQGIKPKAKTKNENEAKLNETDAVTETATEAEAKAEAFHKS